MHNIEYDALLIKGAYIEDALAKGKSVTIHVFVFFFSASSSKIVF